MRGEGREAQRGHSPLRGTVVAGAHRGGLLGFPTANLDVKAGPLPRAGVYAGWVRLEGRGPWLPAAVSVGTNVTFAGRGLKMEVHILDYSGGPLYGRTVEVRLAAHLRRQRKFETPEALSDQMKQDCAQARRLLADRPPPEAASRGRTG
jgi:riboflavin kinase/FMN adenylyltransferase